MMLTEKDNELLTRTGRNTPMGTVFRRYWLPALLSDELPRDRRDPVQVQMLGETFVAWRDESGEVGFFDEACPHRCASLALARCEPGGLRCLYHGWKFAVDGRIVEAPNSLQAPSSKIRATVYPCREAGGLIWVYLGPAELMPEFPQLPFFEGRDGHVQVTRTVIRGNWLQSLEGHLDSSHASILHQDWDPFTGKAATNIAALLRDDSDAKSEDLRPAFETEDLPYGFQVAALRDGEMRGAKGKFARIHLFVLPSMTVVPPKAYMFEVPIDDNSVSMYAVVWNPDQAVGDLEPLMGDPRMYTVGTTPKVKTFEGTRENRWFQDRERMHRGESFSGIPGFMAEDSAIVASMGPIVDRTKEHLVASDVGVVRMRRMLLRAVADLQQGTEPYKASASDACRMVAGEGFLPAGHDWRELMRRE